MELINLLPDYYDRNETMKTLQKTISVETDRLDDGLQTTILDCSVLTTTNLLSRREIEYGLSVEVSKPITFRRERIGAKMIGSGTTTKQMIKQTAASFSNGEVEVTEDNPNSRYIVKFVGTIGIPANMEDLTETLEEIQPAHMYFEYEYVYNTYESIKKLTHKQLKAYTQWQIRNEVLSNGNDNH